MAKTIAQLPALAAVPDDTDELVISDAGVTKKVTAANLKGDCIRTVSDVIAIPDADNISFGTTTGSKIGTATSQKLAFYNATPIVQPAAAAQAEPAAQSQDTVTDSTGGSASTTLAAITAPAANATTSLTNDMTAVKNALASIAAQLAKIKTDVANIKTLQNAERTALVNLGLIKGTA